MSNITVLTPAYNRGKLLEKLYKSLCAQDCKDFEWLIVDDGSTDDTSERVEQMTQTADFPIFYHKKENGGKHTAPGSVRNQFAVVEHPADGSGGNTRLFCHLSKHGRRVAHSCFCCYRH